MKTIYVHWFEIAAFDFYLVYYNMLILGNKKDIIN
jgi:hypothetical protein